MNHPIKHSIIPLLVLILSGCASRPGMRQADDFQLRQEKLLYTALREAHAGDEQRARILALYDEHRPRLEALQTEAESILNLWHELDRRDPAFSRQAAALAEKWATVSGQRMAVTSGFDQGVVAVLDGDQWQAWQAVWFRPEMGPREGGLPDGGGGGQSRRRR